MPSYMVEAYMPCSHAGARAAARRAPPPLRSSLARAAYRCPLRSHDVPPGRRDLLPPRRGALRRCRRRGQPSRGARSDAHRSRCRSALKALSDLARRPTGRAKSSAGWSGCARSVVRSEGSPHSGRKTCSTATTHRGSTARSGRFTTASPLKHPRALALVVLSGALLAASLSFGTDVAHAAYTAQVRAGTLVVDGNAASDKLSLRLQPGAPNILQLDVGEDGTTDFSFDRSTFTAIAVDAGQRRRRDSHRSERRRLHRRGDHAQRR